MDAFIGEIRLFPFDYAPYGWLLCNGAQLQISDYQALYAVIGRTYGASATTFRVPDLTGQAAMAAGAAGQGLAVREVGGQVGTFMTPIPDSAFYPHTHQVQTKKYSKAESVNIPSQSVYLSQPFNVKLYSDSVATGILNVATIGVTGTAPFTGKSRPNQQPYLVLNYCICFDGVYPVKP